MCFIQKLYRGKRTIIRHSDNLILLNLLLLVDATRPGLDPRSSVPFIVPITAKREKKTLTMATASVRLSAKVSDVS